MNINSHWPIFILCITLSGCSVYKNAYRTLVLEPRSFPYKHDGEASKATYEAWAEEAWNNQLAANPELASSCSYEAGFYDGFIDYTFAGGNGEPPAIPPREFWNLEFRNDCGQEEARLWFAGFRHGVQVSREGGYREQTILKMDNGCTSQADLDAWFGNPQDSLSGNEHDSQPNIISDSTRAMNPENPQSSPQQRVPIQVEENMPELLPQPVDKTAIPATSKRLPNNPFN